MLLWELILIVPVKLQALEIDRPATGSILQPWLGGLTLDLDIGSVLETRSVHYSPRRSKENEGPARWIAVFQRDHERLTRELLISW